VIKAAKLDYKLHGLGYRLLARKYTIPHSTVAYLATCQKWIKFGPPPPGLPDGYKAARDVETAILAQGLGDRLRARPRANGIPDDPAMKRPRGRPRIHPRPEENPTEPIQSRQSVKDPSALEVQPPDPLSSETAATGSPADPLSPSPSGVPDWTKAVRPPSPKTANIINFPKSGPPRPRGAMAIQLPPETNPEGRAQLRIVLSTIKAMMTLEQVEQLEHHEGLLRLYSHLIEVYLDPKRFIDLDGLDDDAKADKILATQKLALRTLPPTERDTLAGAIKTLTSSLQASIILKRAVVGLNGGKGRAAPPTSDPLERQAEPRGEIVDFSTMSLARKRHAQEAMVLLERHQHAQPDAPKPPLPEGIEDLRHPDFPLEQVDRNDPEFQ